MRDVRDLLEAEAADVIVVKPVRVGGPGAVAEIAASAAARGVPVVVSTLFETGDRDRRGPGDGREVAGCHDRRAGPTRSTTAWRRPGCSSTTCSLGSFVVSDGRMRAPGGAGAGGLGVVLDARALDRFRVESIGSLRMTLRPLVSGTLAESARVVARAGGAGRIALVDGSTRWTWADLDARADAVARGLVTAGVGAGARVAVVALPSAAAVATLHGIARVGAVAAPVGTGLTA